MIYTASAWRYCIACERPTRLVFHDAHGRRFRSECIMCEINRAFPQKELPTLRATTDGVDVDLGGVVVSLGMTSRERISDD